MMALRPVLKTQLRVAHPLVLALGVCLCLASSAQAVVVIVVPPPPPPATSRFQAPFSFSDTGPAPIQAVAGPTDQQSFANTFRNSQYLTGTPGGFYFNFPEFTTPPSLSSLDLTSSRTFAIGSAGFKGAINIDGSMHTIINDATTVTLTVTGTLFNSHKLQVGNTASYTFTFDQTHSAIQPDPYSVVANEVLPADSYTMVQTVHLALQNPNGTGPVTVDPWFDMGITATPEPSALVLGGFGMALLPIYLWRRKKTAA